MTDSIALHLLSAVIWVGGMFFAYMALRPAAAKILEPPARLQLWVQVFKLFFLWVWLSIITLLITGYWMLFGVFGGFANAGMHIHIMNGAGLLMVLIYLHVFFAPYRKLRHAGRSRRVRDLRLDRKVHPGHWDSGRQDLSKGGKACVVREPQGEGRKHQESGSGLVPWDRGRSDAPGRNEGAAGAALRC